MPLITRLVAGKRDPSRINLYLDHNFAFTLSAEEVVKHRLKSGLELSDEQVSELKSLGSEEKLFGKILNYLSYRPRSRRELETRLHKYLLGHDNPQPVITSILSRLDELGYVDDLKFATWFVESRMSSRPRSARHLRFELMGKGIDRAVIDQVIHEQGDDESAIKALIAKKSGTPPDKLIAFLARRGFSYDLIRTAIDEVGNLK